MGVDRFYTMISGLDAMTREAIVLQLRFLALLQHLGLPLIQAPVPAGVGVSVRKVRAMDRALQKYAHADELVRALRTIVDECRGGAVERVSFLRAAFDCRKFVPVSRLGCTRDEVMRWHREYVVQHIRTLLEACRRGECDKITELVMFLEGSADQRMFETPILPAECGTSQVELELLKRRAAKDRR